MARQILPLAGAVIGGIIAPGAGAQWGFAIGSIIGNIVDPIEVQGRKLGDSPTQTAAEGGARAIVFGKGCIRATVILERGGRDPVKQRDKSGKGGPTTVNERAFWTYAIGLGEAIPGGAILRIWEAEKLVYDVTPGSQIVAESAKYAEQFRFYDGSEDQLPDPALEALHGTGNAPYYRGTAYIVFPRRDLTDFGETVPVYRVEVAAALPSYTYEYLEWEPDQFGRVWTPPDGVSSIDAVLVVAGGGASGGGYGETPTVADAGAGGGEVVLARGVAVSGPVPVYVAGRSTQGLGAKGEDSAFGGISALGGSGGRHSNTGGVSTPGDDGFTGGGGNAGSVSGSPSGGTGVGGLAGGGGYYDGSAGAAGGGAGVGGEGHSGSITGGGDGGPGIDMSELFAQYGDEGWFGAGGGGGSSTSMSESGGDGGRGGGGTGGGEHPEDGVDGCGGGAGGGDVTSIGARGGQGGIYLRYAIAGNDGRIPLAQIIAAMHDRSGHSAADYDVAELSELTDGVVIESTVTAAEAINSIIGCHFADPSDYDGQIHYIKRGKPVVKVLTADDLIDEPESAQRNNAIEYPRKAHFLANRADLAYAASKSTSSRYSADAKVVGEVSYTSPETFSEPQQPAEIAVKLHKVLWTEAEGERTWHVTDEHLDLVPSDTVGLSYRGELVRCRITQVEDDPGQRKLKMIRDRQSAYTANLTEIPNPVPPTPPQPSIVAPTVLAVMDLPALTDNADTLNYYGGMSGANDTWAGAVLQQSLDGGASFGSVGDTTLNAIMGTLQTTVADASQHYTDATNVVEVTLFTDDDLESRTQEAFLSQGGAFALSWQDSGVTRWELMQFRDAEHVSGNTWRLTHLLRGRKNTETAEHPPGAMFVLIDQSILRLPAQSAWLNTDLTHRAVSNGLSPETATPQANEYVGYSQREWPVAELMLDRAGDDITATVVPRHRFGTSMHPVRSINWDGYRWTATDGTNSITRDGTADSETFDVTGWASPVSVTVSQLNRITGAGDAVTEEIA